MLHSRCGAAQTYLSLTVYWSVRGGDVMSQYVRLLLSSRYNAANFAFDSEHLQHSDVPIMIPAGMIMWVINSMVLSPSFLRMQVQST